MNDSTHGLEGLLAGYSNLVFFDCETSGLDAERDRVIELAALSVTADGDEQSLDEFMYLPPGEHLTEKIVNLTGITEELLNSQGRAEVYVAVKFAEMLGRTGGRTLLIAHNAQFDLNFAAQMFIRIRFRYPTSFRSFLETQSMYSDSEAETMLKQFSSCDYLDTLTVFKDRRAYPHKLEDAIKEYGLSGKVTNSHRAIDDVKALFEMTKRMGQERDDLANYINIFGFHAKYGISGKKLKKVTYWPHTYADYMRQPEQTVPALARGGIPDAT